jgi:hypothetical protein
VNKFEERNMYIILKVYNIDKGLADYRQNVGVAAYLEAQYKR